MKKIKAFYYIYKNSISSPAYYKEMLSTKLKFSIKYYVVLILVASLIMATFESVQLIPDIKSSAEEIIVNIRELYPRDLEITIEEGSWSLNKDLPYSLPFPMEQTEGLPSNLVVFDKEGTINDLDKYDTLLLVNDVNIIVKETNEISAYPLEGLPNVTIDYSMYETGVSNLEKVVDILPYLVALFVLFGLLIYFLIVRIVYLAFVAVVVLVLGAIGKAPLNYKNAYRIALHAMTLPITLQVLFSIANISDKIPFASWFFLVNLVFAVFVITDLGKGSVELNKKS